MKMVGNRGNSPEVGGLGEVFVGTKPLDVFPRSLGATSGVKGGAFSIGADNGAAVMAAGLAGASEIFQFRWAPVNTPKVCVVKKINIDLGTVIAFVAGRLLLRLFKARAWTVNGTGGVQVLPAAAANKRRTGVAGNATDHADSELVAGAGGDLRISQTAALTAGTKTLEAVSIASIALGAPTTIGPILTDIPLLPAPGADGWPMVLEPNEGLVIVADVPGTGTWYFGVDIDWVEKDDYR